MSNGCTSMEGHTWKPHWKTFDGVDSCGGLVCEKCEAKMPIHEVADVINYLYENDMVPELLAKKMYPSAVVVKEKASKPKTAEEVNEILLGVTERIIEILMKRMDGSQREAEQMLTILRENGLLENE